MTMETAKRRRVHLLAAGMVATMALTAALVVARLGPDAEAPTAEPAAGPMTQSVAASAGVTLANVPNRAVVESGVASWYGAELAGELTASGEPFDPEAMTAAHPELPFGTTVTVVNLENGRAVEVVINDRGPFTDDRIIDVSQAAARKLGFKDDGTAEVQIEIEPEVLATITSSEA